MGRDDRGWPYSEFTEDKEDQIRKPKPPAKPRVKPPKNTTVANPRPGFMDRLKNLFLGGTSAPEDIVEEPVDESDQQIVKGDDVIMVIPKDARKIIVQILESNGRLKNQYTLTNYISVSGGDKFRVIVEK